MKAVLKAHDVLLDLAFHLISTDDGDQADEFFEMAHSTARQLYANYMEICFARIPKDFHEPVWMMMQRTKNPQPFLETFNII